MTTFNYYQQIKKSALKTLIEHGVNCRTAFSMLKNEMPYLFLGKKMLDGIDECNSKFPIA